MGDYSTNLRTQSLNARVHVVNSLTEFRFDKNTMYTSALRLANVGVTCATGQTDTYNKRAGVLACIKEMSLMDGSRVLSSLRYAQDYLAFKNINATNEKIQNLHDALHSSRASNQLVGSAEVDGGIESNTNIKPASGTTDATLGYVDLRLILPILSELSSLDTSVFKNLRLVINWNASNLIVGNDKSNTLTVNEPLLIVDEIVGDKRQALVKSEYKQPIVWNEIEHDMFVVPTGVQTGLTDTSEAVQEVNKVINGFDNKYLSRLLMVKTYQNKSLNYAGDGALSGNLVSLSMFKEELNVRSKGMNIFNGDGLSNQGFKQMLLAETWGDISYMPFGALTSVGLDQPGVQNANLNGVAPRSGTDNNERKNVQIGSFDYIGFQVEDVVKQLQFNYKRTIVKDAEASLKNSMAMDVHLYGEVKKQLSFSNGSYSVSYLN